CAVGPFAHLRMNARMEERAVVGNFVEVKKSKIGRGTKSMHLTYLGDATIVEDDVRSGSDTMLVAPVRVGEGSITGAGSVVTEDVPPQTLVAGVPARVKKKLGESK